MRPQAANETIPTSNTGVGRERHAFAGLASCSDQRALLAAGFEIPQPPSLQATGRDLQVDTPVVEQFVCTITRFGRTAF